MTSDANIGRSSQRQRFLRNPVEMDFSCQYSDNLPEIFKKLNISLAFTSYQASRLMLVRSDGESLDINFKTFARPMGMAATSDGLILGTFTQVLKFQREDGLLEKIKQPLPNIEKDITTPRLHGKNPDGDIHASEENSAANNETERDPYEMSLHEPVDARVDACLIARAAHYTGMINIHDIGWGEGGLWAVNSSFSCLCTLDSHYSFVPRWKPFFISALAPEDRCHLNGMALRDGKPAYVTTFSKFDQAAQWRKSKEFDGTLMDVERNEILVDGLSMPHSPRWHRNKVYFCNSGLGQVYSLDPKTGEPELIADLPGFTRGIDFFGPIMMVGLSRVRATDVSRPAPLAQKYSETFSGIWLINLEDKSVIGSIQFTGNVEQIYDVAVLDRCSFPEIIEPTHPRMRNHFCYPTLQA